MVDFADMIQEKLTTHRRYCLALMEINRFLKSMAEGIQFAKSVRYLKECYSWSFDRWSDTYSKSKVPFNQRHGLLDKRCRIYFLNIMKMSEKRGREVFGNDGWMEKKGIRVKRLLQVCKEGQCEYDNTMCDVDTCPYSVMDQAIVRMDSYNVQC